MTTIRVASADTSLTDLEENIVPMNGGDQVGELWAPGRCSFQGQSLSQGSNVSGGMEVTFPKIQGILSDLGLEMVEATNVLKITPFPSLIQKEWHTKLIQNALDL